MRAVVCGAGIAGLTLAWWLERDGWRVLLVERAPGLRDEGYLIDFAGSGYDVAELMGLLPELRRIQTTTRTVCYVDPAGRAVGRLDYASLAAAFDHRLCTFMRGDLERVLHGALGGRVPVRYGTTVDSVRGMADGLEVALSDGTIARCDLLVGADGIHSRVRRLTFGPEKEVLRYLGYHTASYVFADEALRAGLGTRVVLVAAPGRQAGLYPVDDGRVAAWFVHRAPDPALPADPCPTLQATYAGLGELAHEALRRCPREDGLYYDHVAQVEMDGWTRGAVTLIGDACQAVSLMAGQGASMAMGSAYVLADELRRGGSVETAAARYERRMRPFVRAKQAAGRRTARWLVPSTRRGITIRHVALSAMRVPGMATLLRPAFAALRASAVAGDPRTPMPPRR